MNLGHRRRPGRLFYGWRVMGVAAVVRFLGGGFHIFGFSIFFLPLIRELGLSRTAGSLVFSLARAEGAVEGPVAGYVIDRLGPRLVMGIGCLVVGVGYLLLSRVNSFLFLLLVYLGLISLGFGSAFMHSTMALANNWFVHRRALAMSIVSASVALGGAILTPLLGLVVHSMGWRMGAVLAGTVIAAVGFPVSRLVRNAPEAMGLSPLVSPAASAESSAALPQTRDFSVGQGMHTPAFWLLTVGTMLRLAGFSAIMVHFVPILVWKGVAEPTAAYYLGLFAFFGIPLHILIAWWSDRWSRPRVMAIGMDLGMVGLILLLYGGKGTLFLFLPLFVVVESLFPVTWATLGDFFGRRHFATVRGFVIMFSMLGPIVGPVFTGRVYDVTESYTLPLQVFIIAFALSSLAFWLLRRPTG